MVNSSAHQSLSKNVGLYPIYKALFQAYCWLPVFFLFFLSKLSIADVLLLESIFFLSVVLLEVPSGYFSDKVGRRATLIISSIGVVIAHSLFLLGAQLAEPFAVFAIAQISLAAGTSFKSGTDTSLHYDSLLALERTNEFSAREAAVEKLGFYAGAGAALLGGAVATLDLSYAYVISLLIGLLTLAITLQFKEPVSDKQRDSVKGFTDQIGKSLKNLSNPALAWLFAYFVLMINLNHVPYEFYQPYIGLLGSESAFFEGTAPLSSGVHTALTMALAGFIAGRSIMLRDKVGLWPTLLLATLLQLCLIGLMAFYFHPIIVLLLIARSVPRALMTAPLNVAIAPNVPQAQRATYLSIQSLFGRLSFSGLLLMLSQLYQLESSSWQTLSSMLSICLWIGTIGLALLVIGLPALNKTKTP